MKERFLLIQEREINAFGMEKAIGGVMVARSKIEDFLNAIRLSLGMGEYDENKPISGSKDFC